MLERETFIRAEEKANDLLKQKKAFLKMYQKWLTIEDPFYETSFELLDLVKDEKPELIYEDSDNAVYNCSDVYSQISDLPQNIIDDVFTYQIIMEAYSKITLAIMKYKKADVLSFADVLNIEKSAEWGAKLTVYLWDLAFNFQLYIRTCEDISELKAKLFVKFIVNIITTTNHVSEAMAKIRQ